MQSMEGATDMTWHVLFCILYFMDWLWLYDSGHRRRRRRRRQLQLEYNRYINTLTV